tara:strand:+ start:326 stop:493 length:168 start_codon:yes stop_codon:yes gene_type:complete
LRRVIPLSRSIVFCAAFVGISSSERERKKNASDEDRGDGILYHDYELKREREEAF